MQYEMVFSCKIQETGGVEWDWESKAHGA